MSRTSQFAVLLAIASLGAHATETETQDVHFGLGLGVGPPGGGGSGIPVGGSAGPKLPVDIVGQYRVTDAFALAFGLGVPIAGAGVTGWLGAELSWQLAEGGGVRWRIYGSPGIQLGFVGPGYYAARSDIFVGFEYIYEGPLTPGLRVPIGTAVSFAHGRLEPFVEFLPVLEFLPSVTVSAGGSLGLRFYFL